MTTREFLLRVPPAKKCSGVCRFTFPETHHNLEQVPELMVRTLQTIWCKYVSLPDKQAELSPASPN